MLTLILGALLGAFITAVFFAASRRRYINQGKDIENARWQRVELALYQRIGRLRADKVELTQALRDNGIALPRAEDRQCSATDEDGERCALPEGHAASHGNATTRSWWRQ